MASTLSRRVAFAGAGKNYFDRVVDGGTYYVHTLEQCLHLPARPDSAGSARRLVADALSHRGAESVADVCVLLTSELVTNAILHARGDVELKIGFAHRLVRIGVGDGSTSPPKPRHAGTDAVSGRGLGLIDAFSSAWGVEPCPGGKEVWFELRW